MTKQEQIEEMAKERNEIKDIMKLLDKCVSLNPMYKSEVASVLYGNNYRKLPKDSIVLSREEYEMLKSLYDQNAEIERLKDDYAKLQELFAQYQMASDKEIRAQKKEAEKRFENNMKSVLEIEKKQAVKDFAEELKAKTMCIKEYEDGTRILQTSNKLIDQSVNIFLTNY